MFVTPYITVIQDTRKRCSWQEAFADGQDDDAPSAMQQSSRVIYVAQDGNNGHVQLPSLAGNGQPDMFKKAFIPQILLACFVFWLFGLLFGLIALILART